MREKMFMEEYPFREQCILDCCDRLFFLNYEFTPCPI